MGLIYCLFSCCTESSKRGEFYIDRSQPEMNLVCPEWRYHVWPERRYLLRPEKTCLVWMETVMSCMASDGDVLYAGDKC